MNLLLQTLPLTGGCLYLFLRTSWHPVTVPVVTPEGFGFFGHPGTWVFLHNQHQGLQTPRSKEVLTRTAHKNPLRPLVNMQISGTFLISYSRVPETKVLGLGTVNLYL